MPRTRKYKSHSPWLRCLACIGFAIALCNSASVTRAQQSRSTSDWDAPKVPISLTDDRAASPSLLQGIHEPSNSVRQQIGLATFDEPVVESQRPPSQEQSQAGSLDAQSKNLATDFAELVNEQAGNATSPDGIWPSIKIGLLFAVLSLAPAIVLMTTCYVRVIVVLTLLRQAFGGQQLPPMQVMTALSLFLTLLIMAPVWTQVKSDAIDPYTREKDPIGWEEAWQRGIEPVKRFMISQIEATGNTDSVAVFYKHLPDAGPLPSSIEQVPVNVLLPAFLISELKVAFLLGFQIFLPFLILDLVVSSVTVSSGMLMLPPTMVSFPLKLILFVMVDGWNLVVGMLLQSFVPS